MSSFLQSQKWADFRQQFGWQVHWVDSTLVLERPLPIVGLSFFYCPELTVNQPGVLLRLKNLVGKIRGKAIFLRVEILNDYHDTEVSRYDHFGGGILETLRDLGFVKAFEEVQPEWRQIIDLTLAEQELLNQMKPKGRYNITVARRHGVTIEQTDSIDDFYHLYLDTNRRQRITGRPKQYFRQLMKHLPKQAVVFIARYKLQPLACAVVIFWQDTVTYLYGGSAAEHRQVMAPYLLHWEIMLEAKKRGCKRYDLGAVAPVLNTESRIQSIYSRFQILDSRSRSLTKKYAGLTRFKQQFGGQTIHIIGSYDLIFKPWWYRLYRLTERARRS